MRTRSGFDYSASGEQNQVTMEEAMPGWAREFMGSIRTSVVEINDRLARLETDREKQGSAKVEAPHFSGSLDPKVYSNWEVDMDNYFDLHDMSDEHKIQFAQMKLTGHAEKYWRSVDFSLWKKRTPISTWEGMKKKLREKYLPPSYKPHPLDLWQPLSVVDYIGQDVKGFQGSVFSQSPIPSRSAPLEFMGRSMVPAPVSNPNERQTSHITLIQPSAFSERLNTQDAPSSFPQPNANVIDLSPDLGISSTFNVSDLVAYQEPTAIPSDLSEPLPILQSEPTFEYPVPIIFTRHEQINGILGEQIVFARDGEYQCYFIRWKSCPPEELWISRDELQWLVPDLLEHHQSCITQDPRGSIPFDPGGIADDDVPIR